MMRSVLLFSLINYAMTSFSQEVGSKTFDLMLQGLLDHSVPEVSVPEVATDQVTLLDAREKNEFEVSKLENAQWVGYDDFSLERVASIPKNEEIVVYCSVGYRSEKIAEKLRNAGFTNVSNLYGGIFEWVNQEKPVVNPQNAPTEKVHAYDRSWGRWLKKGKKVYK